MVGVYEGAADGEAADSSRFIGWIFLLMRSRKVGCT